MQSFDQSGAQLVVEFYGATGKATLTLRNTIISGDGSKPNFHARGGTFVSLGHNLSSDGGGGFLTGPGDLINVNPLLGPLQDNGGPTKTMALRLGSAAIDAGDNTDAPDFDQRGPGFPRIVGGIIDIGAFEVQPGAATHFQIDAPSQVTSNTPFDVTVTALDVYGHTAAGYLGMVTFSTSDVDPGVVLPADYTFTAQDGGVHAFPAGIILITPGDQTLTVTDTNGITGSTRVTVVPGPIPPPAGGASTGIRPPSLSTDKAFAAVDRLFAAVRGPKSWFELTRRQHDASAEDFFDLINTNPLLGPLRNNGGPTQTMALLPGSPAIDVV